MKEEIIEQSNFKVGDDEFTSKYVCYCGCSTFEVYKEGYYTSVKCTQCGNEDVVHDG